MDSYEERLKTFENKNWFDSTKAYTPETLAICGFYADKKSDIMTVKCFLCKKVLEGWDDTEVPIIEHYSHRKTCVIFSPNLIKSRRALIVKEKDSDVLAKNNFVKYNLSKDKPYLFCFRCGSEDVKHKCPVKEVYKFDLKEDSKFFFVKLTSGKLSELVKENLKTRICISETSKEALEPLMDELEEFDGNKTLGEFIKNYIKEKIKMVNEKIDESLTSM